MNYYEHHLGDYAKDTGHLTMLEHGAYRLLLDRYYSTEAGIPAAQAHRLARARSTEECQAVDAVLEEFFTLVDGAWINNRAEEEIESAVSRISAAQTNGKKGGRPPKKPISSENKTQQKPTGFCEGSENKTQQKAYQAPGTKHQAPDVNPLSQAAACTEPESRTTAHAAALPADPIVGRAIELTSLLTKRGASLQASDPRVRAWASNGVTDTQALQALDIANERRQERADPRPINAGLLDAILPDVTDLPIAKARASPNGSRRQTLTEKRAETIANLTGANRNERQSNTERDITAEVIRLT